MTWFQDGSPCRYFFGLPENRLLSVGWLSSSKTFSKGIIDPSDRNALQILRDQPLPRCSLRMMSMRLGGHICEFCDDDSRGYHNVFVPDLALIQVWVFPALLLHYVDAHRYRPPEPFLTAMRACPKIGSKLYFEQLNLCLGRGVNDLLGPVTSKTEIPSFLRT